jgi:hypothetical protein
MNGEDGLVLTLFPFGADTQFRYLNKIKPCFFFPLAIEIEAGGCSRTCPIYLDDWLVSTLLTPICQTAAQCDQLCLRA